MDLVQQAQEHLAGSGISLNAADFAGIYVVDSATEVDVGYRDLPALVFPYFGPDGQQLTDAKDRPFERVRYLAQPAAGKKLRYAQRAGSGTKAYFPKVAGLDWQAVLDDPEHPLLITEGEKKALAATLAGYPTIGLGGVFNWGGYGTLLPELAAVAWKGRRVYLVFDSDIVTNSNVMVAEARLSDVLELKQGAKVFRARIPEPEDRSQKVGLDDLLVAKGVDELRKILDAAMPLRPLDKEILTLNQHVAWLEDEGRVFDVDTQTRIAKDNFVRGSAYSTKKVTVPRTDGRGVKHINVAEAWLTSPLARRHDGVIFKPLDDEIIDGRLNIWKGYTTQEGDVTPWLRLTSHLMEHMPDELRLFPHHLLAYKAQNPTEKPPLALVFIGPQGCGKSFWCELVVDAFAPYGLAIPSEALTSQFNSWAEGSLIAYIDEAQAVHLSRGDDMLKKLITQKQTQLRRLYAEPRQIESYTMYMLTSNKHEVGSYAADDRRMVVVDTPKPAHRALYDEVRAWRQTGGAAKLMHYLLSYDLKGWRPPQRAPETAEKHMAYMESLTPVQRLAEDMRTATANTVKLWIDQAIESALAMELSPMTAAKGQEIRGMLARYQIRPWYTAEELLIMYPHIAYSMHGSKKVEVNTPGDLSRQLRNSGIPFLRNLDDPRGFMRHGRLQQYLVICEPERWGKPITQAEFDKRMALWPEYKDLLDAGTGR